ncbi:MAG TPA: hypothetical protein VI454_11035 [Verrucomicrobiae bacterium]
MKRITTFICCLIVAISGTARAQDPKVVVPGDLKGTRPVLITVSGFGGEVDSVLRFDLFVQGFEFVTADKAQFQLAGSNSGRVEGRLIDPLTKQQILAKAYTGTSLRTQAHALADEIVEAILHMKGIGRTKIAFKCDKGSTSEIYIADFDGHNAEAATADGSIVAAPTWAPGRRALYYTSYKLSNPDIYSQTLASGERHIVARYSGLNTSAAISPDGRHVAMILSRSGSPNVWIADADGANLRQVTKIPEGASSPCWSPDGTTICFSSSSTGRAALYLVSAAGGQPRRLSTIGTPNATEPDWSPDGKTIVFTSQMGDFQICTVPASGGEAAVLAAGEDPSWAPNSRTVVFARRAGGKRILSMLDAPTKRVKELPAISGSCSQPSWSK